MPLHTLIRMMALCLFIITILGFSNYSFRSSAQPEFPREMDVRGAEGVPKGTYLRRPHAGQLKAIKSLEASINAPVAVRYNGLTATPRHIFSYQTYLTPPRSAKPETIARDFLQRYSDIFNFTASDLKNLRLKSRATTSDTGTTIMLFEQQVGGVPVYQGNVMVNVNRLGQIINVGCESFPSLKVINTATITPAQAVTAAATDLGISNFTPQSLGTDRELATYGDLPPEYTEGQKFSRGGAFSEDIFVTRVVFPLGDVGRHAYRLTLTTPQYYGILWETIVDAETGQVLRRISLTSFFGPRGGGQGAGRLGTLRPDVQDMLEAMNPAGTAQGKVFDSVPTALSGVLGFGRSTGPGVAPAYGGRGFQQSQVHARTESPLVYSAPFGQVLRGLPDAQNPSASSPFGWFYLPTDSNGQEVTVSDTNRTTTRDFGYTMAAEARSRNIGANSPTGDGNQTFSATLTPLAGGVALPDGRVLTSVFESNYTEGNNILACDDRGNDDDVTKGIRGFGLSRVFNASYFDFLNGYEYGGVDAGGTPFFPASANADVYPGAVNLFYFNNLLHDYLYSIGFTEKFWNFQQDNFGKGGAGNDAVSAQVQDGSGTNNANMSTPAEGSATSVPRMQMYLFTESVLRRSDGDFDIDVVAHELYHGVSNRSVAKGGSGALGFGFAGEARGQGEGWSDTIAQSITDDDGAGEYVTGEFDRGIRSLPVTNFRWSYAGITNRLRFRRDRGTPDVSISTGVSTGPPFINLPFQEHHAGTIWSAMLWDMRELLIMKDPNGIFFDGTRRLGNGASFYIGNRLVRSVDSLHPIDYRESFDTSISTTNANGLPVVLPSINPDEHIVRPRLVAAELAQLGHRNGPLSSAVSRAARLADSLVLRGMQLSPLNPSFVDSRDALLLADREMTDGENQAIIWRAFASHGVGTGAESTAGAGEDQFSTTVSVVIEDFNVPAEVTQCEGVGPLAPPNFIARNMVGNTVTININDGIPIREAASYIILRSASANGPFVRIAEIPALDTVYRDNNNGEGLQTGQTWHYQVRAARNSMCVSAGNTRSVTITVGGALTPAPVFEGAKQVEDPRQCNRLIVSWDPAASSNPAANIVYDIYRVSSVAASDGTTPPAFTPSDANRIARGVSGTSYSDASLTAGRVYYYIVQARDTSNGKRDSNNAGNTVVRFNSPTSDARSSTPIFASESFENASSNNRFTPQLVDSATPNTAMPVFQRVPGVTLSEGVSSSVMYAPDFSPTEGATPDPLGTRYGGPSDFSVVIGPLTLSATSLMEFDHFFSAEATFDGGVIEVALGAPIFAASPYPNNTTTFDVGNYIVEGGYNGKLDGLIENAAMGSPLQGRRAYTGTKELHHVRVALGSFAPGGANNSLGRPVYLRFRMTSDVATAMGPRGGWYIDNLVINNIDPASCPAGLAQLGTSADLHAVASRLAIARVRDAACARRRFNTTAIG